MRTILVTFIAIIFLLSKCSYADESWKLVSSAASFQTSTGIYPAAQYFIDTNSMDFNNKIITFDMKQVLEKPLSNKARVIIVKSAAMDCEKNIFRFSEAYSYDIKNNFLSKEIEDNLLHIPETNPENSKNVMVSVRDYICKITMSDEELTTLQEELLQQTIKTLETKFSRNLTKSESREVEILINLISEIYEDSNELQTNYERKLSKYKFDKYLSPSNLKDKNTIKNSQKEVLEIKELIYEHEQKALSLLSVDSIEKKLEGTNLSKKVYESFWKGYLKGFNKNFELLARYYQIEQDIFNDIYQLLNFLFIAHKDYSVIDGQLIFSSDKSFNEYNSHISKLEELLKEENKIRLQALNSWSQVLNNL